MENIFHPAPARFPTPGLIPDATDILGPEHLTLKCEGTQIMKRCLVSPGCNLNDVHAQCGRLSLGGVYDFCAHFTARRLWLVPH